MEEEISEIKHFLKDFINQQIQSPTSDDVPTRIVNYGLESEEISGQVIDWILNYLDNRKCPYSLAILIAREVAQELSASFSQREAGDVEKNCNAVDLYSEAISKIPAICNKFSSEANLKSICSTKYTTSVFAIKNKRRKMEDRHVIHHDLNAVLGLKDAPHQSYYAVFDGHSGADAAHYASSQLHFNIARHPEFLSDTSKAIIEGYNITDLNFLNKCNKWGIKSGCTAISAIIRNSTLYLSWVGDSQAVLVKGGVPVTVTSPHKPDREDERHRIEKLGGHISHMGTWRVNGLLAVTRAIGDPDQKQFISSEPELDIINLDGTEDFLILACDGLWDGISPEDASSVLYRYFADSSPDDTVDAVAAKLVHQSKLQGSEDNITAVVVFLRNIKDIRESAAHIISNSQLRSQNYDFMAVNGNAQLFSMDLNSDTFSKPTVLELNAASSKKLKNAANVMSSAGFGSASFNYQCVENLAENAFQSLNQSNISQTICMSQTAHTASCFPPEATALSELPTPPIDDILASQQFENFYSTDLYKELNSSLQTTQNSETASDNVVMNSESNNQLLLDAETSSKVTFVSSMNVGEISLFNSEDNLSNLNTIISPDEAVGIATTVVSSTIETAVKCLSDETQDNSNSSDSSNSKLNPYAKPFVMKSFFNSEDSSSLCSTSVKETETVSDNASKSFPETNTNQLQITAENEIVSESIFEKSVADNSSPGHSIESENASGDILVKKENSVLDNENISEKISNETDTGNDFLLKTTQKNVPVDDLSNVPEKSPVLDESPFEKVKKLNCESLSAENELPEQHPNENTKTLFSDLMQQEIPANFSEIVEQSSRHNMSLETVTSQIVGNPFSENLHTTEENLVETYSKKLTATDSFCEEFDNLRLQSVSNITSGSTVTPDTNMLPRTDESANTNINSLSYDSHPSPVKTSEPESLSVTPVFDELISTQNLDSEKSTSVVTVFALECEAEKSKVKESQETLQSEIICNMESELPESKQTEKEQYAASEQQLTIDTIERISEKNAELVLSHDTEIINISDELVSENIKNEEKSKCEDFQKNVVDSVEKLEISAPASLIEPLSLINIKDELIPAESVVPSDPSVEDSRLEPVAVDLKSLPESIPEAEGVTEDIDSDSEKDGGWSYMKGNTVVGSKLKDKTVKSAKVNEAKSSATSKTKRDLTKTTLDSKSRLKSANVDKTKTISTDKVKNIASASKTKTTTTDKIKNVPADKTKASESVDKSKTVTSVDKKVMAEKRLDVKSKVTKSSTLPTTSKVTADKVTKTTTVSAVKKEMSSSSKTSSTIKSTRQATLLRTTVPTTKSVSPTVSDRSAGISKTSAKTKIVSTSLANKSDVKNVTSTSSSVSRAPNSAQIKTNMISNRNTVTRPATTLPVKSSAAARVAQQKSTISEPKPRLPLSTSAASLKKSTVSATKKSDIKEVKDNVNKQILAKKTTVSGKAEAASATGNKRIASTNNRIAISKAGSATKPEVSKKDVPKASSLKSTGKNVGSKLTKVVSKSKEKINETVPNKTDESVQNKTDEFVQNKTDESVQNKTDESKNILNIESDQKNVTETAQVVEEKFILETSDKEKAKEMEDGNEKHTIVGNGSLIDPVSLEEDNVPVATPENL